MIGSLRRSPLLAALALFAAGLAVVIGIEIASGGIGASIPAPSSRRVVAAEPKLLPPIVAAAPEQTYPEMAARPLWIPTRRPAPQAMASADAFTRGQFVLQGAIIAGGTRIALLREKTSGRVHRVEQGKDVNGIRVLEIEPEKVVLTQGGEREELALVVQKPGAASPGQGALAPPPGGAPQGPFGAPAAPTAANPNPTASPRRLPQGNEPAVAQPRSASPNPAGSANPSAAAVPQQATTAPMTPEELLARRRARRTQSPQ